LSSRLSSSLISTSSDSLRAGSSSFAVSSIYTFIVIRTPSSQHTFRHATNAGLGVPEGYISQKVNGFVEELMVNDDPEYQWIDKIRTPRASNEARQTLFMKLSGAVQRKIGLKALELGGNAVVGYARLISSVCPCI
jgi:hypothetical protein